MDPSVSIVVPVQNAQATLPAQIANLLDVMSDLANCFEIVVVDDASSDETEDVAIELARKYPQLRVVHHDPLHGSDTPVMTGLASAVGDVVFVMDAPTEMSVRRLQELWRLRDYEQLVMAHADCTTSGQETGIIRRLMDWGEALKENSELNPGVGAVQMIRRRAVQRIGKSKDRNLVIDRVDNTDTAIKEPSLSGPATMVHFTNSATTV